MVALLSLLSALASPGSAGALHLGASPLSAGTQFAGIGVGAAWVGPYVVGLPVIEAGTAIGDRGALVVTAGVGLGGDAPTTPLLVQSRVLLVDDPALRFAVTLSASAFPYYAADPASVALHLTPGLSVESGEAVRFDATVPIWGLSSYGRYVGPERFPVPVLSSVGVSGAVGDGHRLRFGFPDGFSWSWRGERVYVDVGGLTVFVAGTLWAKVGAVF